jgi:predicted transcriptional regulator
MSAKVELSEPISLRLPVDTLAAIEKVAKACDRTRSWVIVRALRRYLMTEGSQILDVIEGRAQIAAGDAHDMDDVLDEVERLVRSPPGEAHATTMTQGRR